MHDHAVTLIRQLTQLTAGHIRVLELLSDPEGWVERRQAPLHGRKTAAGKYRLREVIGNALRSEMSSVDGLETILKDLESRRLLMTSGLGDLIDVEGDLHLLGLISELGRELVDFVTWTGQPVVGPADKLTSGRRSSLLV